MAHLLYIFETLHMQEEPDVVVNQRRNNEKEGDEDEEREGGEEREDLLAMTGLVDYMGTLVPGMDLPNMDCLPPDLPPKRRDLMGASNGEESGTVGRDLEGGGGGLRSLTGPSRHAAETRT